MEVAVLAKGCSSCLTGKRAHLRRILIDQVPEVLQLHRNLLLALRAVARHANSWDHLTQSASAEPHSHGTACDTFSRVSTARDPEKVLMRTLHRAPHVRRTRLQLLVVSVECGTRSNLMWL